MADTGNKRVLEFDLNTNNQLVDKTPDHVLGQATFYTATSAITQSGMSGPYAVAYDNTNSRLFVADSNRVLVYNVASIINGQNAVNVLGQTTFTTNGAATTQSGINGVIDIAYDTAHSRLFVGENPNGRVTVYNVSP